MKIDLARKSQAGASMTEVVIAAALLTLMVAGIFNSFGYGFFASQLARENQRATQIILEKVETLRLYRWDQVTSNGFIPSSFTETYDPQAAPNAQGVTYSGTVTISPTPWICSYSDKMRQVDVTLTWSTAGRLPHTRSLTTFVSKDGLQNYVY